MLLGFKQSFPWNEPTYFKEKIILSTTGISEQIIKPGVSIKPKLHTIRELHRWKSGMIMHMAYGVRTKNYDQFNRHFPELQTVRSVQNINIDPMARRIAIYKKNEWVEFGPGADLIKIMAENDGFNSVEDFWRWFCKPMKGQLIHWTELKY